MNEVKHFCSQHVAHVKYRRHLCEKLRSDVIMDRKKVKYRQLLIQVFRNLVFQFSTPQIKILKPVLLVLSSSHFSLFLQNHRGEEVLKS